VALSGLDARGVAVVGAVPAGLPDLKPADVVARPDRSGGQRRRSFAPKNHYETDADREMAAPGADLAQMLRAQGAELVAAGRMTPLFELRSSLGMTERPGLFPALPDAGRGGAGVSSDARGGARRRRAGVA
jgi:hypothetical protein